GHPLRGGRVPARRLSEEYQAERSPARRPRRRLRDACSPPGSLDCDSRARAFVTLSPLLFLRIPTTAPATPTLSDRLYNILAPQPSEGLTELGEAAVRAMFCKGILIDVTHMSEPAIWATIALLEDLEKKYSITPVPVLATHIACRFGTYQYNLSDDTIREIGKR